VLFLCKCNDFNLRPEFLLGNYTNKGFSYWWERPKDLSVVIDYFLAESTFGPHIDPARSPDRKNFFVTIGHGRPYGTALKYSSSDDRVEKQVELGLFPATADVTPDGNFLFVVNFNLHGDPVPSNVSVVDVNQMMELARIPTCIMPHGSRITRDGSKQYSACMMDDLLVEIDTEKMAVSRTFRLSAGLSAATRASPRKRKRQNALWNIRKAV
jgi:hypothetical protein